MNESTQIDPREHAGRCEACGGITYIGSTLYAPAGGILAAMPQYHASLACLSVAVARAAQKEPKPS